MNITYCSSFLKKTVTSDAFMTSKKMKFVMVFLEFVCVELKCDFLSQNYISEIRTIFRKESFSEISNKQDGCIIIG